LPLHLVYCIMVAGVLDFDGISQGVFMELSVKELAEHYGVSRTAVYNWIRAGLPARWVKVIGKNPYRVINPDDVEKFHGIDKGG
jgi:hypothetical protein